MTTLNAICDALAEQIRAQLSADINVYPRPIADPRAPYVMLMPSSPLAAFHGSYGPQATGTVNLRLKIGVSAARDPDLYRQLYDLLWVGTDNVSVTDAVEFVSSDGKRSLGGLVTDCWSGQSDIVEEDPPYGLINVQMLVSRS